MKDWYGSCAVENHEHSQSGYPVSGQTSWIRGFPNTKQECQYPSWTSSLVLVLSYNEGKLQTGSAVTAWSKVCLEHPTVLSASQEVACFLWKPEVHCRVHVSRPAVLIQNQVQSTTFKHWILEINFNIIISPAPMITEWYLHFRLYNQNFERISHYHRAYYMHRLPLLFE
jgi:hypothetical protein